ncbi:MAG TPA: hypothetical protein VEF91_08155 [Verrucomicrobiae bacterium]|nr:hypothetical protein [Verrucomicrobiae bacterium]
MSSKGDRVYVLVVIQPGKEEEFANEVVSKGLTLSSKVERMDFVHGSFDFIIIFSGDKEDIDWRILQMRRLPYVRSTQTLIPFQLLKLEDLSAAVSNGASVAEKPC